MSKNVIQVVIDATDNASSVIQNFGQGLQAAGVLAFAKEVGAAALELAKIGQQSQAAETRLAAFAGSAQAAEAALAAIDAATGGTISRMDAAASATRLFQMGLATTADEAANVVKVATLLGDQTQGAGERVADFSALLANQSIPRLDNFGISSARVRTRIEELQAAMPGLSRETAFMQAVMAEAAVSMDKLGTSSGAALSGTARLAAEVSNLKASVGEQLAPSLNEGAGRLADLVGAAADTQVAINNATEGMGFFEKRVVVAQAVLGTFIPNMGGVRDTAWEMTDVLSRSTEQLGQQVVEVGMSAVVYEQYNAALQSSATAAATAAHEQQLHALAATNSAESVSQYNFAIQSQEQAAAAAATAQRDMAAATAEAARVANEAKIAFIDAAAGMQEMSKASFASAQLESLKQAQEAGQLTLEQYAQAQQSVLMEFGVLTQAEVAAQGKVENLTAAFIAGRIGPDEYAAALVGVKEKIDITAESENVLAAAAANAAATATSASAAAASESEALGLLTGQSAITATALDVYTVASDSAASAAGNVASVAGEQSGAMDGLAGSSDNAAGALDRVQARINALQDKTVTVTVKQVGAGVLESKGLGEFDGMSGMAAGFSGVFATPTARLFGEGGPEIVRATPLQKVMNETYNVTYNAAPSFGRVSQDIAFARARAGR